MCASCSLCVRPAQGCTLSSWPGLEFSTLTLQGAHVHMAARQGIEGCLTCEPLAVLRAQSQPTGTQGWDRSGACK